MIEHDEGRALSTEELDTAAETATRIRYLGCNGRIYNGIVCWRIKDRVKVCYDVPGFGAIDAYLEPPNWFRVRDKDSFPKVAHGQRFQTKEG